jgi:very-short-patch-repair endonuclease/transcription elongation GreA/GreB family factor
VNKDGKFYQRFGSINQNIGYKLLNVIVTRAKYKVFVCTSIPEEIFLNYKELLAIDGNNKRAAFFAYLAYAKAVHEKNNDARQSVLDNLNEYSTNKLNINQYNDKLESPFEEEVYNALIENFDKSKLIPQLKYAGFRIDIVYESNIKGVPKIAIECDGASYHSSQEAYLNDIHRQKILEDCGFVFHRIWSTKWWRNPKGETNRLVEFIKEIENKHTINSHDKLNKKDDKHFDIINSLNDEINFDFRSNLIDRNIKLDADIINHTSNEKTELIRKDRGKSVNENSVLEIKYLSIDKKIKIKLTSNKSDKIKKSNGVQEIFIMSPLGAALIDKFVGDTVKIGGLDKYVEIINIL